MSHPISDNHRILLCRVPSGTRLARTLITLISLISLISPTQISAQSMSNEEFILDLNPSKTPTTSQSPIPKPTDSPKTPQEIIFPTSKLRFSVSSTIINYGRLAPGEPIIRDLTINLGSNTGASVVASGSDSLKSEDNQEIPDTTCDEGTCTELIPAKWTSPLTYGFGYRCEDINGTSCDRSFLHQNIYKQFPNASNKEAFEIINDSVTTKATSSKINLKVNIPGSLTETSFSNTIQIVALPKLQSGN